MGTSIIISVVLYRIATVLCGLAFAFLGFRLFCLGISERAGELQATFGDKGLLIRQVAPGIYFALFGTIIVAVSVYRGVDISSQNSVAGGSVSAESPNTEKGDKTNRTKPPSKTENNAVGELLGIDPQLDLDNMPQRLLDIVERMQTDGENSLNNQQKQLLNIWIGKLKARVTAENAGIES